MPSKNKLIQSRKHISCHIIELLLKAAASTLHLIISTCVLIQVCLKFVLCISVFARCIQVHSFSVSFAIVTIYKGEVSMDSQCLTLRLFHKLQRVIAKIACYFTDYLSIKSNKIYAKLLVLRSKCRMMRWTPINSDS